jgi:hypothetical protein
MKRFADWEDRLSTYLDGLRGKPFAWGKNDCATFAAGAVQAMTGEDVIPEVRGRYTTARGSVRTLRKHAAGTLAATVTAKFGEPVDHAQRGDIVMHDGSLAISFGAFAIAVGEQGGAQGLIRIPLPFDGWEHAWRVPFAS